MLHFMGGHIFILRCVCKEQNQRSPPGVNDVTACYLPWQHSSFLALVHVSTRVKHTRAAWWAVTGTSELSLDCNFGYYSFLGFSSPSASQRAIVCPGRECPRLPSTEMLWKCGEPNSETWAAFCMHYMCKLTVNTGWGSVLWVRQDLLCSWRWAHTTWLNPQRLMSFSRWLFSASSVAMPRLMGAGEIGSCCL